MSLIANLCSELCLSVQTNFAELFERCQAQMMGRSIAELPGSFPSMVKPHFAIHSTQCYIIDADVDL